MTPATRLLAAGLTAFLLLGALPALFGVALPLWSARFGLGPGQGGTLLAAYNAGAFVTVALGTIGAPGLAMRPALAAVALGALGLAMGPVWGALLAAGFVAGLGYGVLAATVNRRFLADFGARGPGLVSLVNGVYGMGSIAAPLLFLAAGGPAAPLALAALLAAAALALAPPEPAAPARGLPRLSPRLLLLLVNAAGVAAEAALIGLGPSALIATGIPAPEAARLAALFFLLFVLARLGLAALSRRIPPDLTVLAAALGLAACTGLAAMGAPRAGFVAAGAFAALGFPAFFVWATRLLGPDPRMGSAILGSGLLAGTLGPLALRPILAASGEGALFWIVSAFSATLALALLVLVPLLRRAPSSPSAA